MQSVKRLHKKGANNNDYQVLPARMVGVIYESSDGDARAAWSRKMWKNLET